MDVSLSPRCQMFHQPERGVECGNVACVGLEERNNTCFLSTKLSCPVCQYHHYDYIPTSAPLIVVFLTRSLETALLFPSLLRLRSDRREDVFHDSPVVY